MKFEIDRKTLEEKVSTEYRTRESIWSECVAVGDRQWIAKLADQLVIGHKEIIRYNCPGGLSESEETYGLRVGKRAGRGLAAYLAEGR